MSLLVLVFGVAVWLVGSITVGAIERWFMKPLYAKSTRALPEPEDPELVSRSRELATWNDPRTWQGCSDYPPPSGVKMEKRR